MVLVLAMYIGITAAGLVELALSGAVTTER